ncbi:MAG: hypothetical protein DRO05_07470 [Thermoproteota archaeon]|nr:MAG: hypothetical protein DRO05_07470 [Candidatus Korarchaeota archaeon]
MSQQKRQESGTAKSSFYKPDLREGTEMVLRKKWEQVVIIHHGSFCAFNARKTATEDDYL